MKRKSNRWIDLSYVSDGFCSENLNRGMMRVFANLWNEITNCLRNDIQKNESASTTHARRVWKHGIFLMLRMDGH